MRQFFLVILLGIAGCSSMPPAPPHLHVELFRLVEAPDIGKAEDGRSIKLGGFSGLCFLGVKDGVREFLTHTDRGPNPDPIALKGGGKARPFLLPKFQPSLVRLEADGATHTIRVRSRNGLVRKGRPATGLPFAAKAPAGGFTTEVAVTLSGKPLAADGAGLDPEGISCSGGGDLWMVEEYGPSLLRVSREGEIEERFVPKGANRAGIVGTEALPEGLRRRRVNRGFEGVAESDGHVFLFLQSSFDEKERWVPVYEFDPVEKRVVAEYRLPFEPGASDKIGDAVSVGGRKFLALEQDSSTGPTSFHRVYELDLGSAVPTKRLIVDLAAAGYDFAEKVEGLAVVDSTTLAVINDDDFAVGVTPGSTVRTSILGLVTLPKPLFQ